MDTKIKILIASVLKPVDDVRSFQKIGRSLAQTNKYAVNIIGFKSKKINNCENISFHPIFSFKRNSFSRIAASWKYYKVYLKVKPDVIIVSSPELLIVSYLIRILFGTVLLYDIQENFRLNIKYGRNYPLLVKPLLNVILNLVEHSSRYFVSGFLLAEKIYETQLPFLKDKNYVTIENKSIRSNIQPDQSPISLSKKSILQIIYTGTIGREYGTIAGIELVKKIYEIKQNINLIIIGYSPDLQYLTSIKESISSSPYIQLLGGDSPVPHAEILAAIQQSDIAILPYEVNYNLKNRIPTKFYEYLACHKPMIVSKNKPWEQILSVYPAALFIDFNKVAPQKLIELIRSTVFYEEVPQEDIFWNSEAEKLIHFIEKIQLK